MKSNMVKLMSNLRWFVFAFVALLALSCEKEQLNDDLLSDNPEESTELEAELRGGLGGPHGGPRGEMGRGRCFELLFPVTVEFPDETTAPANSKEELKELLRAWREANPDATERPTIAYPHDVKLRNGRTVTVNNEDELRRLVALCRENRPHFPFTGIDRCFRLVFPITVAFPDGTTGTANSRDELQELYRAWYEANPDAEGRPRFQYPFDIKFRNGDVVTIDSEDDLLLAIRSCPPNRRPHHPFLGIANCFDVLFPVTVEFPDGTTQEAANRPELYAIFENWRDANPDAEEWPTIAFPLEIRLRGGRVVTISNEDELMRAVYSCGRPQPHRPFFGIPNCFSILFPVNIDFPDGGSAEAGNVLEMTALFLNWKLENPGAEGHPSLGYPVNIRLRNGSQATVESQEALLEIIEGCADDRPFLGIENCFRMVYPVTVAFPDGTTEQADNPVEVHALYRNWRSQNPNSPNKPTIAYPFNIKYFNGTEATINNDEELSAAKAQCR